jgi:hypothetical protein
VEFGDGHHRVDLYVDDKLFESARFDIEPDKTDPGT